MDSSWGFRHLYVILVFADERWDLVMWVIQFPSCLCKSESFNCICWYGFSQVASQQILPSHVRKAITILTFERHMSISLTLISREVYSIYYFSIFNRVVLVTSICLLEPLICVTHVSLMGSGHNSFRLILTHVIFSRHAVKPIGDYRKRIALKAICFHVNTE